MRQSVRFIVVKRPLNIDQYEFNKVFAGRNWNNGEVVGMCVIKSKSMSYSPTT